MVYNGLISDPSHNFTHEFVVTNEIRGFEAGKSLLGFSGSEFPLRLPSSDIHKSIMRRATNPQVQVRDWRTHNFRLRDADFNK